MYIAPWPSPTQASPGRVRQGLEGSNPSIDDAPQTLATPREDTALSTDGSTCAGTGPSPSTSAAVPSSQQLVAQGLALSSAAAQAATPGFASHGLRVILAGPPGAGKTTHGERLAQLFGVPHISMGDLLRREVQRGTDLGRQIGGLLQQGDLVPAPVAEACMRQRLEEPDAQQGFVLDGFPRRTDDAATLQSFCAEKGLPPVPMVCIEVSEDEVLRRVENRRVCDQGHTVDIVQNPPHVPGQCDCCGGELKRRNDDTPTTVHHRFDVYHAETQPVLDAYAQAGLLYHVDGNGSVEEVAARVDAAALKANGR